MIASFWSISVLLCLVNLGVSLIAEDPLRMGLKQMGFQGAIFVPGEIGYHKFRLGHTGTCKFAFPKLVARPRTSADVAFGVMLARSENISLSVRSGGHGYLCQHLKNNSLHLDLRRLNHMHLLTPDPEKNLPLRLNLGPGSTWGRVLKQFPISRYSMVHGQCTTVGVGGYLLGGGVNFVGTSSKLGSGSQNVMEYTMISATGDLLKVSENAIQTLHLNESVKDTLLEPKNDLFFALKGAGSSFGIVTNFLYQIYDEPETQPVLVPIFFRGPSDLEKLKRLNANGLFDVSIFRLYHLIDMDPVQGSWYNTFLASAPLLSKLINFSSQEAVGALVVDIYSGRQRTDLIEAVNLLHSFGMELAFTNLGGIGILTLRIMKFDQFDPFLRTYDSQYLSQEDQLRKGPQASASASFINARSPRIVEDFIFNNSHFGNYQDSVNLRHDLGCDWCYWTLVIWNGPKRPLFFANDPPPDQKGIYTLDFTCQYDPHSSAQAKRCENVVQLAKARMSKIAEEEGEHLNQYYNTPSCDINGRPFYERYWHHHYETLLAQKQIWDPTNLLTHCHAVGSTDEDCCPTV
ncbi:uncharacterized protein LOC131880586 [Tigriopus californicus]|uniref:uncharacterized protein LOC131880586 n=1 Tax=Tigriopus californicus TaxID=6832 RepID=UPI0027DA24E0|nr:uncharacterized protein LOC131880586 [Tigriopus californicus]